MSEKLNRSIHAENADIGLMVKSCPRCSQHQGRLVFYKWPSEFGSSDVRPDGSQSWCAQCRANYKIGKNGG